MDTLDGMGPLTEREWALVRETEPARLAELDEDALVELHLRVRRARDRQVKIYRRQAAALVADVGGRGGARPRNTRNRAKAEVFEEALARVSRRLAVAADESAAALRAERLADAQRDAAPQGSPARTRGGTPLTPQRAANRPENPVLQRRRATERASGARRQARRDAR